MTSRDRVIRTLNHQPIDRAPRDLWLMQGVESHCAEALAEMNLRFPADIAQIDGKPAAGKRSKAAAPRAGHRQMDAWGCACPTDAQGEPGPAEQPPLADAAQMAAYLPPAEMLAAARFAAVNRLCEGSSRFMLVWSDVRPLARMQALRGPEAAIVDLTDGNKVARGLLGRLHEHFRREMELWAGSNVDGVAIHDNLGVPAAPRVTSKLWRLLKPLYRDYCQALHAQDKFAFFYSKGKIGDLYGELISLGFDAIYAQVPLVDLEQLAANYRGRVAFWVDLGPQRIAPPATHEEIRQEVRRVRKLLDFGSGVIARCPWGPGTPLRNVVAFFEEWMTALPAGA
jgi:hypothetical protein